MRREERLGFAVVSMGVAGVCLFLLVVFGFGAFSAGIPAQKTPVTVDVHKGETLTALAGRLAEEGVLAHPVLFRLLAIARGDAANIKAGEYLFTESVSPNALLDELISGNARYVSLTIPEGFNLREVAQRVEAKGLGSAERFVALATDDEFIAGLDLPFSPKRSTLEGLLFPETYYLHRGVSEAHLIRVLVEEFANRAVPALRRGTAELDMTPYEAVVLASIIEKETSVGKERPLISAVFHNRLRTGMPLGSDPTVIYGLDDFDGNLTRAHLRARTDYNTYRVRGLPPTPIANPGMASLRAAVQPADVDYLYFVSRGDGTHEFNTDLESHNKAVWKYQIKPHRNRNS